jgi:hypothetical protein
MVRGTGKQFRTSVFFGLLDCSGLPRLNPIAWFRAQPAAALANKLMNIKKRPKFFMTIPFVLRITLLYTVAKRNRQCPRLSARNLLSSLGTTGARNSDCPGPGALIARSWFGYNLAAS